MTYKRLIKLMEETVQDLPVSRWERALDDVYYTEVRRNAFGIGYRSWENLVNRFVEERKRLAELNALAGGNA